MGPEDRPRDDEPADQEEYEAWEKRHDTENAMTDKPNEPTSEKVEKLPRYRAVKSGQSNIVGKEGMPYPAHIKYIYRDMEGRRCTRFVCDFNLVPESDELAERIAGYLNNDLERTP